jgi:hypothetical protein
LGISNPIYGTLTFGRTNSLALDVTSAYDPVASTAFSTLGFSAAFSGFGSSPSVRPNTAFTYRLTYQNFRAAVQAQVGSYGIGNSTNGMYQGQLGFDFGSLSLDGVLSWAKDAVSLSSFAGSNMTCLSPGNCFINVNNQFFDPNTVLRATLPNNLGGELVARYKWDPFTFYGVCRRRRGVIVSDAPAQCAAARLPAPPGRHGQQEERDRHQRHANKKHCAGNELQTRDPPREHERDQRGEHRYQQEEHRNVTVVVFRRRQRHLIKDSPGGGSSQRTQEQQQDRHRRRLA